MKKEIICDTNIFYNYFKMYKAKRKNYLPSFYNFEDLFASKSNLKNLDNRLQRTLNSKLKNIINHEVLFFEPHYYVLKSIFPQSNYSRVLYQRINEHNPNSYINALSQIILDGENVPQNLKDQISAHAKASNLKKIDNAKKANQFAKRIYKACGYKEKKDVNYLDFIPYVVDLTIGQLNLYRKSHMINTDEVTQDNFDSNKYELFIKTYSKYLSTLVGIEGENPALNDNIDSLILLYVTPERKIMTCENKWLNLIKDVQLHKKYIEPYSQSWLQNMINWFRLKVNGNVQFSGFK